MFVVLEDPEINVKFYNSNWRLTSCVKLNTKLRRLNQTIAPSKKVLKSQLIFVCIVCCVQGAQNLLPVDGPMQPSLYSGIRDYRPIITCACAICAYPPSISGVNNMSVFRKILIYFQTWGRYLVKIYYSSPQIKKTRLSVSEFCLLQVFHPCILSHHTFVDINYFIFKKTPLEIYSPVLKYLNTQKWKNFHSKLF